MRLEREAEARWWQALKVGYKGFKLTCTYFICTIGSPERILSKTMT